MVFLHGRGDTAQHFAAALHRSRTSTGLTLFQAFPTFKWVFPQAPTRELASSPGKRCPQWFDVWNVRDFSEREELQSEGLKGSVLAIRDVLRNEVDHVEGKWDKMMLAGISQGAATGVHVLANLDVPGSGIGAFLGFSCRFPFQRETLEEVRSVLGLSEVPAHDAVLRHTSILLQHCIDDPLVLVGNGRELAETLRRFGAQVEWKEYASGGHWFNSPKGMDDAVKFIEDHTFRDWMLSGVKRYQDTIETNWPDLTDSNNSGGEVLHYHGESDPQVPAASSVRYYESVRSVMYPDITYNGSIDALNDFYQLFLIPGAGHCSTSTQPEPFPESTLLTLIDWVEGGINPVTLNGTISGGTKEGRQEQICSWPLRPYWTNNGTTFQCQFSQDAIDAFTWDFDGLKIPISTDAASQGCDGTWQRHQELEV